MIRTEIKRGLLISSLIEQKIGILSLRVPLIIHFGGQINLSASRRRQTKTALSSNKADLSSLPENKNLLPAAQKQ